MNKANQIFAMLIGIVLMVSGCDQRPVDLREGGVIVRLTEFADGTIYKVRQYIDKEPPGAYFNYTFTGENGFANVGDVIVYSNGFMYATSQKVDQ